MGKCKINSVHSENSDAKAHILKMCLPACPSLSVQEVLGQRNVPWFSSCKIKLAECSLIWRHFCKSFEQFQIWSGVWPSNPCSPHYFRPAWVQDCNHGAPTALVVVTQVEKGDCTYPSDDCRKMCPLKPHWQMRFSDLFSFPWKESSKEVGPRGMCSIERGGWGCAKVSTKTLLSLLQLDLAWACCLIHKSSAVSLRSRIMTDSCAFPFDCSPMQQPHAKCLLVLK